MIVSTQHKILAMLAALLLSGCQKAYFSALNVRSGHAPVQSVEFDSTRKLWLDIYRPPAPAADSPVVVFFYGGSWRRGNREFYRFVGEALSRRGVWVIIPDYRKAPADIFPAFMEDAAEATAWVRGHVASLPGDPRKIYLMGHSAGAHIAALLATDGRYLARWKMQPRELAGVIGLAGPYDFLPITDPGIRQVFGSESNWPLSQPVNFVDGDEPPFLLLHGASDRVVWQQNSEHLAQRLQALGEPVTLRIFSHTGHTGLVNGFVSPRFSPVLEETLRWIARHPPSSSPGGQVGGVSSSVPVHNQP